MVYESLTARCRSPLYNGKCLSGDCSPNVGGPLVKGGCAQCCVDPGKCSACCPGNASTVPGLEGLFHEFGNPRTIMAGIWVAFFSRIHINIDHRAIVYTLAS